MHDLFNPRIPPENLMSGRFRVHAVKSDTMEPVLRGGRDYALLAPVTAYQGEGIYLVDDGLSLDLYRVSNTLEKGGALCLSRENPRYGARTIGREEFNDRVVGIVVADIKVRCERFLAKP
ncbi:hypothetical protein GHK38_03700 [Sinorhizobium meliloti]|uniref:hypothetical protein n=1 Tax=Rhizobium meliloti TaxID=382 RepID=UPI000B4A53D1|nr:hypothetical protein [Sinorhizobium meliloti]ASQ03627.1 hypothetical protein CDO23_06480 [Sinorhizobium meliloti]MQV38738.1 hypothetical protein [Sinorhizobium meliloti]